MARRPADVRRAHEAAALTMALRLYLLRHAKAEHTGVADIDRPLSRRGREEAEELAALLRAEDYQPQAILCSTSLRTRETIAPLIPALSGAVQISLTRLLYDADRDDLLALVREAEAPSLMLVGHNPGIEELAALLIGHGDEVAYARLKSKFPPGGLAVIDFELQAWSGVSPAAGRLAAFHTPS